MLITQIIVNELTNNIFQLINFFLLLLSVFRHHLLTLVFFSLEQYRGHRELTKLYHGSKMKNNQPT